MPVALLPAVTVYNFSPGPAVLPAQVHERIRDELGDRDGRVALLEVGHRGDEFSEMADCAERRLRRLLDVPCDYRILFLPGGATAQYAMVPLNLAGDGRPCDYFDSGYWSQRAIAEAQRYGRVNVVARPVRASGFSLMPQEQWNFSENAAYCHFVDNETLTGIEFPLHHIDYQGVLVSDMTSNFLTRSFDPGRFGLVYAGAQKNVGIAGITLLIVREELLGKQRQLTPTLYSYATHAQAGSRYNTPPVFPWYVCAMVLEWIEDQGGVAEMERRAFDRARCLYGCIDDSDLYENRVAPDWRSRVNVHFRTEPARLEEDFLKSAEREGFLGLRGHRRTGGIRASLYNGMTLSGVRSLVNFMQHFENTH